MLHGALDGNVAIVTGAGSPIDLGPAMVLALVQAGARVAMLDVDADALSQSAADARQLGGPYCSAPIVAASKPSERVVEGGARGVYDEHRAGAPEGGRHRQRARARWNGRYQSAAQG